MSHQQISSVKSFARICGYILLPLDIVVATVVLLGSEVIGLFEEVGQE
jgi:hypothetical protein